MLTKIKSWRSDKYRAFIREQECCNCGIPANVTTIHCHHVNGERLGKSMGGKVSDCFCIPLCPACHSLIHTDKEALDQKRNALLMIEIALNEGVLRG